MAKDLPYFKFFCSEWNDGDITLEDMKVQGVFINVCSYYWSNECELTITKLRKRFKSFKNEIDTLFSESLIREDDDFVYVNFLDEQKDEREERSKQSSIAGKASAERRRLAKLDKESNINPTPVEIPFNEKPTIKRREEEKREEETNQSKIDFDALLKLINTQTKREFKVINKSIQAKYIARLKDGYTKDDIKNTIINSVKEEYHKETNFKYLTPEYYSRAKTIDQYSQGEQVKEVKATFSYFKDIND